MWTILEVKIICFNSTADETERDLDNGGFQIKRQLIKFCLRKRLPFKLQSYESPNTEIISGPVQTVGVSRLS